MMSNSQFVTTTQGTLSFRQAGEGLPIVMLHGQGASKDIFEKQFSSPLVQYHRLIAFDLIGCGESEHARDPERTYTITGMAEALNEALDTLGVEKAILYGWSLGGHVALEMLHLRPERVAGIMMSGTPPVHAGLLSILRGFHTRFEMARALRPEITREAAERFAELCCGQDMAPAYADTLLASDGQMRTMMSQSLMHGDGADQRILAETCPVPLAVVNGSDDPLVRVKYIKSVHYANLWEDRCHIIEGGGHAPFLITPNIFNILMHRFATHVGISQERGQPEPELAKSA
jgi:pimeloyl-ACP methyl ester carboxylesterase